MIIVVLFFTHYFLYYTVRQKTAPFYFCNSFVRTSTFITMFGTRIQQ